MSVNNEKTKKENMIYHVGLKIILKKKNEFLFLIDSVGNHLDFPGGRIDETEKNVPLNEIIAREVKEEIGEEVKYKISKPVFQFRRYFEKKNLNIFITIYEAEYLSGEIKLSAEHSSFQWIDPRKVDLKKDQFFNKEEYLAFMNYFKNLKKSKK